MITIGDLGCLKVDTEEWRKANRAPLYPGKINRWIVIHTLDGDPSPDDLKAELAATFAKWFDGSFVDPHLTYQGTTRSGAADLIRVERVSQDRLWFPSTARRREDLPGTPPMARAGKVVWLEVSFSYRGELTDMPWPVHTNSWAPIPSAHECPVDADWVLDSVALATDPAPPELSSGDKAGGLLGNTASEIKAQALSALWIPAALAALGLAVYFSLKGTARGSA